MIIIAVEPQSRQTRNVIQLTHRLNSRLTSHHIHTYTHTLVASETVVAHTHTLTKERPRKHHVIACYCDYNDHRQNGMQNCASVWPQFCTLHLLNILMSESKLPMDVSVEAHGFGLHLGPRDRRELKWNSNLSWCLQLRWDLIRSREARRLAGTKLAFALGYDANATLCLVQNTQAKPKSRAKMAC